MKKSTIFFFALSILLLNNQISFNQSVGINLDGSPPDASAMLDVMSGNKGVLIPNVALNGTTDVTTIPLPAMSLLVYNTATASDVTPGYYFWSGSAWTRLSTLWAKSSPNIYYEGGKVGIGTQTPINELDVTNPNPGEGVAVGVNTDDSGGALAAYSSTFPLTYFADRISLWSNAFTTSGIDIRADGPVSDIRFYTGGLEPSNERMRIKSNGAIGVGTDSPVSKFTVDNGGISTISYRDDGLGSWQQGLWFANNPNGMGPWGHAGIWSDGRTGYNGELVFGTDGDSINNFNIQEAMRINKKGYLGIGTSFPLAKLHVMPNMVIGGVAPATGYALSVGGKIMAEEMRIEDVFGWPDYVFENDYCLPPIGELKKSIASHGHLPGIPSAEDVHSEGIMVGDMQKRQMEKIEELTLYIIQLHERIAELEKKVE